MENQENLQPNFWICPSWIKTTCSRQLHYRLQNVEKSADLAIWDSTLHDKTVRKLGILFAEKEYFVRIEVKHQHDFPGFTLAHWFDLIAIKNDFTMIIEVKPRDRDHNKKQYSYAQLLANAIYDRFSYCVFEYETQRLIPKSKPNYELTIRSIQEKLDDAETAEPKPSDQCTFCPYSICKFHPQYKT